MGAKKADRDPKKLCVVIRDDGTPCGRYKLKDSQYCYADDPRYKAKNVARMNEARLSKAPAGKRKISQAQPSDGSDTVEYPKVDLSPEIFKCPPQMESPRAVQAHLANVVALVGKNPAYSKVGSLHFKLGDAAFKRFKIEGNDGPIPDNVLEGTEIAGNGPDGDAIPPIEDAGDEDFDLGETNETSEPEGQAPAS